MMDEAMVRDDHQYDLPHFRLGQHPRYGSTSEAKEQIGNSDGAMALP
jgi:hypothetical protein